MRWSQYYIPTLRETPADAEVVSHRLMLKAGVIRKLAAGIYSYLPLGFRALHKLETIVRQEMDRAGALQVHLPAIQPAELWMQSDRWGKYGSELLRLRDRHQREFCFGPTHEEVIVDSIRGELRSYKGLPRTFYQIQTKFRDEIRPRFGLMRGREFSMKDAYSFDRDAAGLDQSFAAMEAAYRSIFERCGLSFRSVEAHSGAIGGDVSNEFHVLANSGEDAIVACSKCDYAANIEKAAVLAPKPSDERPTAQPASEVATPGKTTIDDVAAFLKVEPSSMIKTLIIEVEGQPLAVLIRGDHELSEVKLTLALAGREWRLATAEQIEKWTGGPLGFSGPVDLEGVRIVADRSVEHMRNAVTGANRADTHLANVNPGADFSATEYLDLRNAEAGEPCPRCGEPVTIMRGIEVGHVFKLGSLYSQKMDATFLDQDGKEQPFVMGCYGLGLGRTVAAAIEQNHDGGGIVWPLSLAPYEVIVTIVNTKDEEVVGVAERFAAALEENGIEVLLDDRNERPGVKFKDADLIGLPLRVTVGARNLKDGKLELSTRREPGEKHLVDVEQALDRLLALRENLK